MYLNFILGSNYFLFMFPFNNNEVTFFEMCQCNPHIKISFSDVFSRKNFNQS